MAPIDIACRECASQEGERCRYGPLDAWVYQDEFHSKRIMDAAGFDDGGEGYRPNAKAFDDAVEQSGLI